METLRYVLLANGLLAAMSIAFYALLRRETFFGANRLALWLGLASALVLPLLELPDWRPQPVRKVMQRTAQVIVPRILPHTATSQPEVTITFPNGKTYRAFPGAPTEPVWSWPMALFTLYGIGALCLLIRFGFRLLSLRQLIRRSSHERYNDFTLVKNEHLTSPFSFFSWVALNPGNHTSEELEQILRHERVHIQSRHSLDMIGAEFVCIVFWINPAAYLFRQLIHQLLEFSADRAVLAEGVDARTYQYNLVKVSLSAKQSVFASHFSSPTLRHRISMINRRQSGLKAWGRYAIWILLMGMMGLACRHKNENRDYTANQVSSLNALLAINPTRVLVTDLEAKGIWYRHMALFQSKSGTQTVQSDPIVVQLKGNQLFLPADYKYASAIYIDGKQTSIEALKKLSPEFVRELFVMHKWENMDDSDPQAKPYQIMIQTSPEPIRFDQQHKRFFTLLQAASISQHPLGESFSFTMNQLLEATFFHNKNALVERTENEHLKVYDEYKDNVEIFINRLPAKSADVATVHVREVARLYTKERPYSAWFRADNPLPRFELHIQTAPKRAKRDSSYYVFSPFYTGDF